jgi:hypothetical protein
VDSAWSGWELGEILTHTNKSSMLFDFKHKFQQHEGKVAQKFVGFAFRYYSISDFSPLPVYLTQRGDLCALKCLIWLCLFTESVRKIYTL